MGLGCLRLAARSHICVDWQTAAGLVLMGCCCRHFTSVRLQHVVNLLVIPQSKLMLPVYRASLVISHMCV